MRFEDFERAAREAFEEIPDEYREGIDGLTIRKEALGHPTLPEVYTLGHCLTEEHVSDYGGPDTTRSIIALYWGSFRELAERDPDFDWEDELWETLTHELRHHLESLAGDDALEDVDYAADELFKRQDGRAFDPWYFQYGEDLGGGVYVVEGLSHVEMTWDSNEGALPDPIELEWRGRRYRIPAPAEPGDVTFLWLLGPDFEDDPVELVLARKRGFWEGLKGVLGLAGAPAVTQLEAEAERVASDG